MIALFIWLGVCALALIIVAYYIGYDSGWYDGERKGHDAGYRAGSDDVRRERSEFEKAMLESEWKEFIDTLPTKE